MSLDHVEISNVSTLGSFSDAFVENCGFKHGSATVNNIFAHVALSLSAHEVYCDQGRLRFKSSRALDLRVCMSFEFSSTE